METVKASKGLLVVKTKKIAIIKKFWDCSINFSKFSLFSKDNIIEKDKEITRVIIVSFLLMFSNEFIDNIKIVIKRNKFIKSNDFIFVSLKDSELGLGINLLFDIKYDSFLLH